MENNHDPSKLNRYLFHVNNRFLIGLSVPYWILVPLKAGIPTKQLLLWGRSWLGEIMFGSLSQNDPSSWLTETENGFMEPKYDAFRRWWNHTPMKNLRLWRLMAIDPNDYLRLWPLMLRVQHPPPPPPPKKETHKSGCQQNHPNLHPFHHQSLPRYMTHRGQPRVMSPQNENDWLENQPRMKMYFLLYPKYGDFPMVMLVFLDGYLQRCSPEQKRKALIILNKSVIWWVHFGRRRNRMGKKQMVPLSFLHKSMALDSYLSHSNRSGSPDNDTQHQPAILNHEIMKELLIIRICCLNNKWCVKKRMFFIAWKSPFKSLPFLGGRESPPISDFKKKIIYRISARVGVAGTGGRFITVCPNFWLKKLNI